MDNEFLNVGGTEETKIEEVVISPEPEEVEVIHETAEGEVIEPAVSE